MSNRKFKPIPQTDFKITFKLDEKSISDWLVHLSNYDGKEACLQTLLLLQALNAAKMDVRTKAHFFNIVHDYLSHFIGSLKNPCWDVGFPLSLEEREYAEAIAWNYLTLGEGFFCIAKQSEKKSDELFSLYAALKYLGLAELHIAAIYCTPNDGFWQLVYSIYAHAEKRKLLDDRINRNELKTVTLNSLFKQILIFQVCDTHQFRPRDMRSIFNFIYKFSDHVAIAKRAGNEKNEFVINLNADNPPLNIKKYQPDPGANLRYFSPLGVAKTLQQVLEKTNPWTGITKSVQSALFRRVIKTLEQIQKRKYDRVQDNRRAMAVIGFYHIICFLRNVTPERPDIPHLKEQIANRLKQYTENNSEKKQLSDSHEFSLKLNAENCFTPHREASEHSSMREVTLVDNSVKGFSVCWNDADIKIQIGDVLGLIVGNAKKRLEIAIIRRIYMKSTDEYKFGTEIMGFDSEAIYLSNTIDKSEGCWGVLVVGMYELNQPDTLIYPINRFASGDKIYLFKEQPCHCLLGEELHCTNSIALVSITYLNNDAQTTIN